MASLQVKIISMQQILDIILQYPILSYLVVINVVTFFIYGIDKWKAIHDKWRISETSLLVWAIIGGSIGAWIGMDVWHHKTNHKKFTYGIPLVLIAQIAIVVLLFKAFGMF